ncbi:MAG: hypothetical protein KAH20_01935 [Methylococcales bacterium]|nr:hypothetical protein [Methylococcales bacterium]
MNFQKFTIFYVVFFTVFTQTTIARTDVQNCPAGHTITKTFSSGSEWSLCWNEEIKQGVVLSNVKFATPGNNLTSVLAEASVSQIQTDFDDGSPQLFSVTTNGLGDSSLVNLSSPDCAGGQLIRNDSNKAVLCQKTKSMGYIWKNGAQHRQGEFLELFSISKANSINYIVSWRLYENGVFEPAIGMSGVLSKFGSNSVYGWPVADNSRIATSFTNHYFWRLDFDIDASGDNDLLEQIESIPSADNLKKSKVITPIQTEKALSANPVNKVFWRVRDGSQQNSNVGFISYELGLLNYAHQAKGNNSEPWLNNDLFVTLYNPCEQFAVKNSTQNGCAENVSQFVSGQNINQKDIVTWYRASYHHLPRDEDIGQVVTRWISLKLIPRDWSSSNPM